MALVDGLLGAIVTGIIAVGAARYQADKTRADNLRLERRREIRLVIEEIKRLLSRVEEQSIAYWTKNKRKTSATEQLVAFSIKKDLKHLSGLLNGISLSVELDTVDSAYQALFDSCTEGDFESAAFRLIKISDARVADIALNSSKLVTELERAFNGAFA